MAEGLSGMGSQQEHSWGHQGAGPTGVAQPVWCQVEYRPRWVRPADRVLDATRENPARLNIHSRFAGAALCFPPGLVSMGAILLHQVATQVGFGGLLGSRCPAWRRGPWCPLYLIHPCF